jgi:hypothetical protein
MKLKILFISSLFFTHLFSEQICLDKIKMQQKIAELSKNESSWFINGVVKLGFLGEGLKKRTFFMEKFSSLSEKKQQEKVEKWLSNKARTTQMLERCDRLSEFHKGKKLDNESLENISKLGKEISEGSLKSQFLCVACGELAMPSNDEMTDGDKKFLHEFQVKTYFHELRKREQLASEERKKELQKLEHEAINSFDSLNDFLHHDVWNGRKVH